MRKFILFFILLILLISFVVFFMKVYIQQKNYFASKDSLQVLEYPTPSSEVGIPSIYKDYSKDIYDMAITENRVLVLYFTANWCAECLKQEVMNKESFMELNKEGVVGLQIHILDSETTTEMTALAKKFDIIKESSFVILDKDGKVNSKYAGSLDPQTLKEKINNAN